MNLPIILVSLFPNAQWSLSENDYSTLEWFGPGPKPTFEELQAAWDNRPLEARKWPSAQEFIEEFTMSERAAISLSTDSQIAALRFTLSTWRAEVHSDDQRVIQGRIALVGAGIITTERADQIFGPLPS